GYNEHSDDVDVFVVEATHKQVHDTTLDIVIDGETLHTTAEHPFFVPERGWVEAGQLNIGDLVRAADGGCGAVEAVTVIDEPQTMYNLTISLVATYLVGEQGWVVHNEDIICELPGRAWQYRSEHPDTRLPKWWDIFVTLEDGRKVAKTKDRLFSNHQYAGRNLNFSDIEDPVVKRMLEKYPKLPQKYPKGVDFDIYGDPIFDIYAIKKPNGKPYLVEIKRMKGNAADYTKANKQAFNKSKRPPIPEHLLGIIDSMSTDVTWHHLLDMKSMLWLPFDLHDAVRHTGVRPILVEASKRGIIDWF
ncbi:MAG: polymorphic toxin-type HINT domain-containing protein, partial [Bacteroidota bacterium]